MGIIADNTHQDGSAAFWGMHAVRPWVSRRIYAMPGRSLIMVMDPPGVNLRDMNSTLCRSLTVLGACLALSASAVNAATIITDFGATAPTGNIVVSQTTANGTDQGQRQWRNSGTRRDLGQTFNLTSSTTIDSIYVRVSAQTSAVGADASGASVTLTLSNYTNTTDFTPDSTVNTFTATLPLTLASSDFIKFDIDNTFLAAGQYGFQLSFDNPSATNKFVNLALNFDSDGYTSGLQVESTDGTNFTAGGGTPDLLFYVQGIPEPTSIGLLALGGLALLARRRK